MSIPGLVSTVIPTYNRRVELPRAIDSALAQTHVQQEILVIDDGSTDGTAQMLAERYADRVRCISRPNGGVSSARNQGMREARGEFIALLDSDDEWMPTKLEKQVALLRSHPDWGMVLCDVQRVDPAHRPTDVLRRREAIPRDGDVLLSLLRMPSLVPASVLMRRSVFDVVGGFDESLRTAEDIDFHLRVATRFGIGVLEEPLVNAMRGHEGLSTYAGTQQDYIHVMERFLLAGRERISAAHAHDALFVAYIRNARSAMVCGRLTVAREILGKALRVSGTLSEWRQIGALCLLLARVALVRRLRG
ncbi:MAG: glycosyltransferase [Steroidobacteraceae bacterium]